MTQSPRERALEAALRAVLDVNDKRRHPLGAPDEGIAYAYADAASKARAALALPSSPPDDAPALTQQDILDHLGNAMNGLAIGWQMANVRDDAKRAELQAPINSASESIQALLKHFDPIAD